MKEHRVRVEDDDESDEDQAEEREIGLQRSAVREAVAIDTWGGEGEGVRASGRKGEDGPCACLPCLLIP